MQVLQKYALQPPSWLTRLAETRYLANQAMRRGALTRENSSGRQSSRLFSNDVLTRRSQDTLDGRAGERCPRAAQRWQGEKQTEPTRPERQRAIGRELAL